MIENIEQLLQTLEQMGRMQRLVESYRAQTMPQSPHNFLLYASGPLEQMRQLQTQIDEYLARQRVGDVSESAALRETPDPK